MQTERARGRMAHEAEHYLLEDEILQNVMPATRGANPLLILTLAAAIAALMFQWVSPLVAVTVGALAAAIVAVATSRAVVLAVTDHAVIVLQASWLGHRPTAIDARYPRRSILRADDSVYAPVDLGETRFWVPFTWTDEAAQADEAWAAVGRTPSLN